MAWCTGQYFKAKIQSQTVSRRRLQHQLFPQCPQKKTPHSQNQKPSKTIETDGCKGMIRLSWQLKHFEKLFNLQAPIMNNSILNYIPNIISIEESDYLTTILDINKIRETVFNLSAHSAAGPHGFNRVFFQTCWGIIKEDISTFVQIFFNGRNLTKFYSHFVLIPKVESPTNFSELRAVSLTNLVQRSSPKSQRES